MKIVDPGVLDKSTCFQFTPTKTAENLFFYPVWCGHYFCTQNYFIKRSNYPPLLVAYIRKGYFNVEYREKIIQACQGDVLLLDCAEPHYYQAEDGLEFVYLNFDGSNAHDICQYIIEKNGWLIQRSNNTLIGDQLFDMVHFYEEGGVETVIQQSARIYRLFELLLSPDKQETTDSNPVAQSIRYIREHIGEIITLDELASSVCLSASYFAHLFKRHTGFTPMEYVINSRIERAKVLLIRTDKPISAIANEVGYSSSASLINLFTKRVGASPLQYRHSHRSTLIYSQFDS